MKIPALSFLKNLTTLTVMLCVLHGHAAEITSKPVTPVVVGNEAKIPVSSPAKFLSQKLNSGDLYSALSKYREKLAQKNATDAISILDKNKGLFGALNQTSPFYDLLYARALIQQGQNQNAQQVLQNGLKTPSEFEAELLHTYIGVLRAETLALQSQSKTIADQQTAAASTPTSPSVKKSEQTVNEDPKTLKATASPTVNGATPLVVAPVVAMAPGTTAPNSAAASAAAEKLTELSQEALAKLLTLVNRSPGEVPATLKFEALSEFAVGLESQKKYREVTKLLQPVLKKAKGSGSYPQLLFSLLNSKRNLGISDCRIAKDLYSRYPDFAKISHWGPLMPLNTISGFQLSCSATIKDIQTRLKRLQIAGQGERALIEVQKLREKGVFDDWSTDSFEINILIALGRNDEALKKLSAHAQSSLLRPAFWILLGKLHGRLGNQAASSGAYRKAYELAPRAKTGLESLFNSAFASYQMQDYDGAEPAFEMIAKRSGRSKIGRDARWHLAWMNYLRHDDLKALEQWNSLLKEKVSRRSRGDSTSWDRIQYWSAMALLNLQRRDEAVERLKPLLKDGSIDYYSILAWNRLKTIPGVKISEVDKKSLFKEDVVTPPVGADTAQESKSAKENPQDSKADIKEETAASEEAEADEETGSNTEEEALMRADIRDPQLQNRLEKVRLLFQAGLEQEARWDLENLDRRLRHPQDRRSLLNELHRMGRWDRSSTLAEINFGPARVRGGLDGAKDLWEMAYPRAWSEVVSENVRGKQVSDDLIWSIMRAESHYRVEARSPVGAMGLMQIMPFTAKRVAGDLLNDNAFQVSSLEKPEMNIRIGARYLQRLSEKFKGSVPLVAAAYNAGPHRVHAWINGFGSQSMDVFIEHIPFLETRNYVKRVTKNFQIYRLLYKDDQRALSWLVNPVGADFNDSPATREVW